MKRIIFEITLLFVLGIVLVFAGLLYFNVYVKIKDLQILHQESLDDTMEVNSYASYIDSELTRAQKQISVLEESIDSHDKRWAKIKQIRDVIQNDIKGINLPRDLTIKDVTTISGAIIDYSEEYDVSISLILAVIRTESAYNTRAVSKTGAIGLMQILPSTAEEISDDIGRKYYSLYKIADNIQMGSWYLYKMTRRFKGDIQLAIKAYNCGPEYVERVIGGDYTDYPSETKAYLKLVTERKKNFEDAGL
jgi:hypothetical protein